MAGGTRVGTGLAVVALATGFLGGAGAGASHNIQRGVSLHYKERAHRFQGKIKSDPAVCLNGLVTLHKIKRGPNRIVGSDRAATDGRWSIAKSARRGRYYATTPSYAVPGGLCRSVRSPVLDLG